MYVFKGCTFLCADMVGVVMSFQWIGSRGDCVSSEFSAGERGAGAGMSPLLSI